MIRPTRAWRTAAVLGVTSLALAACGGDGDEPADESTATSGGEATQEAELRLVIGQLEEFARRVSQELQGPDWDTRREIVRALVKKVEVDEQEIRIVYRVRPSPFEGGPQQGRSQHCWGRGQARLRRRRGQRAG